MGLFRVGVLRVEIHGSGFRVSGSGFGALGFRGVDLKGRGLRKLSPNFECLHESRGVPWFASDSRNRALGQ